LSPSRSGINAVQAGQVEAARAIGMTFGQTLRLVVLPQAFRSVLPPLASVFIALIKNTSVAAGFGITEAVFRMGGVVRDAPTAVIPVFIGVAFGYIILVAIIAFFFRFLESRLAVAR
jgi:glutamate transport system permease protein